MRVKKIKAYMVYEFRYYPKQDKMVKIWYDFQNSTWRVKKTDGCITFNLTQANLVATINCAFLIKLQEYSED